MKIACGECLKEKDNRVRGQVKDVKKGFPEEVIFRLRLKAGSQLAGLPGVAEGSASSEVCETCYG